MQRTDRFSGRQTSLVGSCLPNTEEWTAILDGHRRRLRALDQLGQNATQCGVRTDKERDLLRIQEDEVGVLANEGGAWAAFDKAIREFRQSLPIVPLSAFGFGLDGGDPFEGGNTELRRIGSGVEALAFADSENSVYKFFLFREGGNVGATFVFTRGEGGLLQATATPSSYRMLFEKLRLIHQFGIPTEIIGITPESIVVAKQTFGRRLPEKEDVSGLNPELLIPIPSRFLRADRDHPRLAFVDGDPWLIADTHDRNIVIDETGVKRIIDLVAAPLPPEWLGQMRLFADWIERARRDPRAEVLAAVDDADL